MVRITLCDSRDGCNNTFEGQFDDDPEGSSQITAECKRDSVNLLLKASRKRFPHDLQADMLRATSIQVTGIQLGLAVESQKASLSVKRRLACEQLSCFGQAHGCLSECKPSHGHGKKQLLFCKWKYSEAKAAAYYYHGLIVDKGKDSSAVGCAMKYLYRKIPEVASRKSQMYGYLLEQEKALQVLPDLPEFALSLRPEEYELPEVDPAWGQTNWEAEAAQKLLDHSKDHDDDDDDD